MEWGALASLVSQARTVLGAPAGADLYTLLGGLGLLLLGMRLLTQGLEGAAGRGLQAMVSRLTASRWRAVATGTLVTAVVQSSSVVTVATVGFVNAGLLGLGQAVALVFGANLGTTITGWLVAAVGLQVDIEPYALPLIGFGALVRLLPRRAGMADTLVGFGLFFLGLEFLERGMGGTVAGLGGLGSSGADPLGLLLCAVAGFLTTVVLQSSSAAVALTLSAASVGALSLPGAAATVIGANVGTTSTALLVSIGATPNARRVALAHTVFNLVTGVVALALLPLLLAFVVDIQAPLHLDAGVATVLALFHTVFNVLGLVLMWPLTTRLVAWLERRFRTSAEDAARPLFLDRNILASGAAGLLALARELARALDVCRRMVASTASAEHGPGPELGGEREVVERLVEQIGDYAIRIERGSLGEASAAGLASAFQAAGYLAEIADGAVEAAVERGRLGSVEDETTAASLATFQGTVVAIVDCCEATTPVAEAGALDARVTAMEDAYRQAKASLLWAGAAGTLRTRRLVAELELLARRRRTADLLARCSALVAGLLRPGTAASQSEPSAQASGVQPDSAPDPPVEAGS